MAVLVKQVSVSENYMAHEMARMAAQNNADWYCMMFDIRGLDYSRSDKAFLGNESPPPYHSWMTTLDPDAVSDQLMLINQNGYRDKFGVKDSFNCLNLAQMGFSELFSAAWIFAEEVPVVETVDWLLIESVKELQLWESAWKEGGSPSEHRQFPDAILDRDDVTIWGRRRFNGYDAGAVANLSDNCVGLSNCFGQDALAVAAALCAEVFNAELPIVGYERGDDLTAALKVGFKESGNLRVWSRP